MDKNYIYKWKSIDLQIKFKGFISFVISVMSTGYLQIHVTVDKEDYQETVLNILSKAKT